MPLKTLLPRTTVVVPDDCIGPDHEVRAIDAFVDALNLPALGFYDAGSQETGAPAYPTAVLLKIYLYGYLHRVRSSRMLEAECGEYALVFTAYHMRRILNIAGVQTLIEAVKALILPVFALWRSIRRPTAKQRTGGAVGGAANLDTLNKYAINLA